MRFRDVVENAWYSEAVRWAAANGIVNGYTEQTFGPNDNIAREQLAAILHRYANYKGYDVSVGEDTNILSFDDAQTISGYAVPAMQWAWRRRPHAGLEPEASAHRGGYTRTGRGYAAPIPRLIPKHLETSTGLHQAGALPVAAIVPNSCRGRCPHRLGGIIRFDENFRRIR